MISASRRGAATASDAQVSRLSYMLEKSHMHAAKHISYSKVTFSYAY